MGILAGYVRKQRRPERTALERKTMSFMPWNQKFELGIAEIDEQHRNLVKLTNALHDEIIANGSRGAALGEILESLVDYTHNHFIAEEMLMETIHYVETVEHKSEHNRFTAKVLDLLTRYESGEPVALEVLEFLKLWLIHHICRVDRAYLPYFKRHTATASNDATGAANEPMGERA